MNEGVMKCMKVTVEDAGETITVKPVDKGEILEIYIDTDRGNSTYKVRPPKGKQLYISGKVESVGSQPTISTSISSTFPADDSRQYLISDYAVRVEGDMGYITLR